MKSKLIVAGLLAGVSLSALADRADRREDHYFWEKTVVAQLAPPPQLAGAAGNVTSHPSFTFGARDNLLVVLPSVRSRAEVRAELGEASRLGLVSVGEADVRFATPAQEAQIGAAGERRGTGGVASRQ